MKLTRRTIALPGLHDLDIAPIQRIIDTRVFQRLRRRKQLGISFLTFPCAQHTRFEHALGTFSMTLERIARWISDGIISPEEGWNIALYGLLHDIGHGPYSHAIEGACRLDHNAHGLLLLKKLKKEITACGGNPAAIRSLFLRKDPLSACVSHRPLGTDKMDYLKRDGRNTHEAVGFRAGDLLNHIYFIDQQLVIDQKIIAEVIQVQRDYAAMHSRVYFRKACAIAQCFLQQIVSRAMLLDPRNLKEEQLFQFTDCELDSFLLSSSDKTTRELFARLDKRKLPKVAVRLIPNEVVPLDNAEGKSIATFRLPLEQLNAFDHLHRRESAAVYERAVANLCGIPPEAVLITPVVSPHRFHLPDVGIYNGSGIIGTLREVRPRHYASLEEELETYAAVRVCVFEEYREKVSNPFLSRDIFEYLIHMASL
ncbi:MAG: HD domain-containing protein [Candidatus Andersenbacteria bacterium]